MIYRILIATLGTIYCTCSFAAGKTEFQVTVKDEFGTQKVNVTSAVQNNVKHSLTEKQLQSYSGKFLFDDFTPAMAGKDVRPVLVPLLKDLLGNRYEELPKTFKNNMTSPMTFQNGVLSAQAGRANQRFHAIYEFGVDGSVRAALKDRGSSGSDKEVATCTDFGKVNPGYFCENDF